MQEFSLFYKFITILDLNYLINISPSMSVVLFGIIYSEELGSVSLIS